jgi:F0F1-type ATP synthase membrane subunit a
MLVINLSIEFLAVPLSLSLRLFANVSSEDKLLYKFAELNAMYRWLPFFFQLFANVLVILFSFIQAFVFLLLSTVYISLILPHDHDEEPDAAPEKSSGPIHSHST